MAENTMANVTFQVVDGVDKGRVFRELPTPVTIGREEGNMLRLNDERVSRYHAKVQQDDDDIILTDLESTNGTRVNNMVVQIRRLRAGDRIHVGRSLLLFGTNEEIAARMAMMDEQANPDHTSDMMPSEEGPATVQAPNSGPLQLDENQDFDLNLKDEKLTITDEAIFIGNKELPPLPLKMSPSQAARFSEILDFLHHGLIKATEHIEAKEDVSEVILSYSDWQRVQIVQMILARYVRAIAEPDTLAD
jgi:pSer/pThr/pTyr-binding forkhead associated (FHA) protein